MGSLLAAYKFLVVGCGIYFPGQFGTQAPCIRRAESKPLDHQESPRLEINVKHQELCAELPPGLVRGHQGNDSEWPIGGHGGTWFPCLFFFSRDSVRGLSTEQILRFYFCNIILKSPLYIFKPWPYR